MIRCPNCKSNKYKILKRGSWLLLGIHPAYGCLNCRTVYVVPKQKRWIVWSGDHHCSTFTYQIKDEAVAKAIQLASEKLGAFYVFEVIGVARKMVAQYESI